MCLMHFYVNAVATKNVIFSWICLYLGVKLKKTLNKQKIKTMQESSIWRDIYKVR